MFFTFSLRPKEYCFFDYFEEHAKKCVEGAFSFLTMLNRLHDAEALAHSIKDTEHAGDKITHRTLEALHKTFITPFDRDLIHRLITKMDDILDFIDGASKRIVLYEIDSIREEAVEMGEVLLNATRQVQECVAGLRQLRYPAFMLQTCVEIKRLENEGDDALSKAMARLFGHSQDAIYVMKWKEIFEYIENAIDTCDDVANTVEDIILENS
jgi:predicted phosphate transport protein (TIGR00153 family)